MFSAQLLIHEYTLPDLRLSSMMKTVQCAMLLSLYMYVTDNEKFFFKGNEVIVPYVISNKRKIDNLSIRLLSHNGQNRIERVIREQSIPS